MSNLPKYKLRERVSSRKQNTQILNFFKSEDNFQSPKLYENNDPDFSSDAPPSKKTRESPQEPEIATSAEAPISTCSTTDPPEEVVKEEFEISLSNKSSSSDKNKRTTKSTAKNSIKQFFEQNESDGEDAPKRKIARKATVQKTNSRAKRGGGRARARQTTIKSALLKNEEVFAELVAQHSKAENIDPNDLQLALAISKSEIETSCHCGGSGEEENTDLIKSTRERLKKYGFKVNGRERDYDIIFKASSRKGKWANKFSPLILRDSETQAKKLEKKIAQIIRCSSPEGLNPSSHIKKNFVMTSDFLKMFISDRDMCRTLHQIDSDYVYDYYVIELFPASNTKVGYLLKDWRKIPGRDLSPPRIKSEIKNDVQEVTPNILKNENDHINVIIDASSENGNGSPKAILGAVENENDSPDNFTNVPKNETNLVESISNASENEDSLKEIQDLSQNELSQKIILNDDEKLAVNVSGNINVSLEYPGNQNVLCTHKTLKGEEIGVTSLIVSDVETIEERKTDFVVEKKNLMDSYNDIDMVRYQQRETSPDLFADSDTSFCETIDCKDSEKLPSPTNLGTFPEKNQLEPVVDNFVISYEKFSSDEVKVSSNIELETFKTVNKEYLKRTSLEEYCIDLTCNSNSNSATLSEEIKKENSEITSTHNTAGFETIMPKMNLLQESQKNDCSHNLSQSQNNPEMDLTGESCIVLSDDEVNYSIKVANKIFLDSVDLTFSSSSEDDQENRKKSNYSIKVPGPKIDPNFSFIALIGEMDTVSPSKSVESLNIDSPMKMSQKTNFQNDSTTSARRNLFLSQTTSFKHDYNTTARKSLSFSNYKTNISSEYKTSPYVERSAPYILADDELSTSTKGCSMLLNQSINLNKQLSSDVEHDITFSKLRESWSPPCTITSTVENKKETTLAKSSSSYRTLSDSYIKTKTSKKSAPYNLFEDKLIGERLDYDKFDDKSLSTKPSNFNKLLSSDEEFSDDEHNAIRFSKHWKSRKHSHTITSTVEKKKGINLEKSSCSNRALSDSFPNVMKSPILKRYATSQKFTKFITEDIDFSDVDEIDKLVYSPIKKLTPKKPQGMDKLLHAELSFTEKTSPRKYVHDGKTYLVRTENISPKPDYERMDSPTILKKLYNYGIKPLKRKHAIAILEHIYDQTHPFIVENDDSHSSDDEGVLRISSSPLKGLQVQKDKKSRSSKSYNTFNLEDCTGEKLLDFDDLSPEIDTEDYIFPTNTRSKVSTACLPFHIAWYNVIKSSYSLREAILHYEPIDLQEIYLFLKKLGYRYDPKDMKKFFDKRCIIFRYDLSDGTSNRHVRKNKGALSQRAL